MATKTNINNISYRKNRDYSKTTKWSREMDEDVYKFYLLAKSDSRKGYTKRLKDLWDNAYPDYKYITPNNLRQRALVTVNKLITPILPDGEDITSNVNNDGFINDNEQQVNNETSEPEVETCLIEEDSEEYKTLKLKFETFYNEFITLDIKERIYSTKIMNNYNIKGIEKMNKFISNLMKTKDLTFWEINVIQYTAAVTLMQYNGILKDAKNTKIKTKQKWTIQPEQQINAIRRKMSYINLILECQKDNSFTRKQNTIRLKVKNICGSLRPEKLISKLAQLRHDLKVCTLNFQDRLKKSERSRINHQFKNNTKQLFRDFKETKLKITEPPLIENVREFWSNIWNKKNKIDANMSPWFKKLESSYFINVKPKQYTITNDIFKLVLSKMQNSKAPGRDKITAYWIKYLTPLHSELRNRMTEVFEGKSNIPEWLVRCKTILIPKNEDTKNPKNYRPIACLNITYKIYTGILNYFLEDHCASNHIISLEQAGGKKGSWGCLDQLLINKMVMEETVKNKRNLFVMWFDYMKAFDSVPHSWLITSLELAKVPRDILAAIKNLTFLWSTEIHLGTEKNYYVTDFIKYLTGILQGDCLSLILFVLCINPLSFLLNTNNEGYEIGRSRNMKDKLTHLLFVDDLKTFAKNKEKAETQLEIITSFTNDIGMTFGMNKCAYMNIENGKRKSLGEKICINNVEISELENGDSYKYLGQDEDISYNGKLNKDRVLQEYYRRVKKIWKSELYSINKVTAHNIYAIPILTSTFGILSWTKSEIEAIDIRTRKILSMTGSFHRNSSVDRLYTERKEGGRGLNSIIDIYVCKIISICAHIKEKSLNHIYLQAVYYHEENKIIRLANELKNALKVNLDEQSNPKQITAEVKKILKENHAKSWKEKSQHGYIIQKQELQSNYDKSFSNNWLTDKFMSSHVEGYICAIQEQEIRTRQLDKKRIYKNNESYSGKCRYCLNCDESIFHILCSCDKLSTSLYLPVRHNEVAKELYNAIIKKYRDIDYISKPEQIFSTTDIEIWWDNKIRVSSAVEHNRPDIVLWEKNEKKCLIIDVCVPLDVNVQKEEKTKRDRYLVLAGALQRIYPNYTFKSIPIVLGATGFIPKTLIQNLMECNFEKISAKPLISKLQRKALMGSLKIVKTALKLK